MLRIDKPAIYGLLKTHPKMKELIAFDSFPEILVDKISEEGLEQLFVDQPAIMKRFLQKWIDPPAEDNFIYTVNALSTKLAATGSYYKLKLYLTPTLQIFYEITNF